ncbi:MAG: transporter substrate-binding domain-containing protein, partial [Gammaproteobacteria bacterium]|nr:transporter substrate-binding domain-containing protein [Gammaproteobacteria bacterium]
MVLLNIKSYLLTLIFFAPLISITAFANIEPNVLELTQSEKKWLNENPNISFTGDPNWLPYEAFDKDGNYIGIVAEHLTIISEKTGIHFEMSPSKTWSESTQKAKQGLVDILSETDDSDLKTHLNFTSPYISNPIVIATRHTENYVENINSIKDKKIALIRDYGYASKIRRTYSNISFYTVENIHDGLLSVSTGEIDALLCTLALCSYSVSEMGLNNVKISGKTEFETKLALGVQKHKPELLSILNKAIATISHEQQQNILDRWIKDKFVEKIDYTLVYYITVASALLLAIFAYWIYRLSSEIKLRTQTEKKLHDSTLRYQSLFDKTTDALLIIEGDKFVDCNQATLNMLGYDSKEELYNTHPSELSPEFQPDGQPSESKANIVIQTAFKNGSHRFEWDHKRKNGEVFPVEVLLTAIPSGDTQLLHVVWRDITVRKQQEEMLRRSQKMDALGKLTGGISHDYNNLLGIISGYSELLAERLVDDPKLIKYVNDIQKAASRGVNLTNKLLSFTKQKATKAVVCNINNLLTDQQLMIEKTLTPKITLKYNLQEDIWPIELDTNDLGDCIINISINSLHAMASGGQLSIHTNNEILNASDASNLDIKAGQYVVLSISDVGHGMNQNTLDHIFDPFYTTKGELGTGLGMSQVFGFVNRSGGAIKVFSKLNHGTRIVIYFPKSKDDVQTPEKTEPN